MFETKANELLNIYPEYRPVWEAAVKVGDKNLMYMVYTFLTDHHKHTTKVEG